MFSILPKDIHNFSTDTLFIHLTRTYFYSLRNNLTYAVFEARLMTEVEAFLPKFQTKITEIQP